MEPKLLILALILAGTAWFAAGRLALPSTSASPPAVTAQVGRAAFQALAAGRFADALRALEQERDDRNPMARLIEQVEEEQPERLSAMLDWLQAGFLEEPARPADPRRDAEVRQAVVFLSENGRAAEALEGLEPLLQDRPMSPPLLLGHAHVVLMEAAARAAAGDELPEDLLRTAESRVRRARELAREPEQRNRAELLSAHLRMLAGDPRQSLVHLEASLADPASSQDVESRLETLYQAAVVAQMTGDQDLARQRFLELVTAWPGLVRSGQLDGVDASLPLPEVSLRALEGLGRPAPAEVAEEVARARAEHRGQEGAMEPLFADLFDLMEVQPPASAADPAEVRQLLARLDTSRALYDRTGSFRSCPTFLLYTQPVVMAHVHRMRAVAFDVLGLPERAAAERQAVGRLTGQG